MKLEHGPGTATVTAAGYRLLVRLDEHAAVLAGPDGRTWSRLSLLASVERLDRADESFALAPLRVTEGRIADEQVVEILAQSSSSAWTDKSVVLRCFDDRLELQATVHGTGTLGTATVLGGQAILGSGACGSFWSSIDFASVFVPTPTEPVHVVRPSAAAAALGVVGDASAGRLHGVFSPPPLCLALGRAAPGRGTEVPAGEWLTTSVVAGIDALRFTELRYVPVDGGFRLEFDYDGHTAVDGTFATPPLLLRPAADPWQGLARYRADLVERGLVPSGRPPAAEWWDEPLFCGWGAQCARAEFPAADPDSAPLAADLARQPEYDEWLAHLAAHDIVPGTVVIDDRWQAAYGAAEPDAARWPDLRGWIAERHAAGQKVLLWWKAWDPTGVPADECVVDPAGTPVAVDPGNPAYVDHLDRIVTGLLGPKGYDADGFKIDFTQRAPAGRSLTRPGAPNDAPWGIAALHRLLATIHRAAKAAKPDALIVTHTPHPSFADVSDMIRLNDVLERDIRGEVVAAADQLAFRHAVATSVLPDHLIDTDQWPIADLAEWRAYVTVQSRLGVPALYYVERIDCSGEPLTDDDLALVAGTWREYRAARALHR
jgi:hypothetical protein